MLFPGFYWSYFVTPSAFPLSLHYSWNAFMNFTTQIKFKYILNINIFTIFASKHNHRQLKSLTLWTIIIKLTQAGSNLNKNPYNFPSNKAASHNHDPTLKIHNPINEADTFIVTNCLGHKTFVELSAHRHRRRQWRLWSYKNDNPRKQWCFYDRLPINLVPGFCPRLKVRQSI